MISIPIWLFILYGVFALPMAVLVLLLLFYILEACYCVLKVAHQLIKALVFLDEGDKDEDK